MLIEVFLTAYYIHDKRVLYTGKIRSRVESIDKLVICGFGQVGDKISFVWEIYSALHRTGMTFIFRNILTFTLLEATSVTEHL